MWFELEIRRPTLPTLRDVFQGQTLEWAIYQAYKKYPGGIVFVPDQPPKPDLARSSNGPKTTLRRNKLLAQQESRS
jgi:hypothetical protein